MTTPVRYIKPLTREQQLLVDTVTTKYEGIGAPFDKEEDDESVTLLIPMGGIKRMFRPDELTPKAEQVHQGSR